MGGVTNLWSHDVLKPRCADAILLMLRVGPPFFVSHPIFSSKVMVPCFHLKGDCGGVV